MLVKFGCRELEVGGKYLDANLRDCNSLLDDAPALHQRFAEDGYLFIRGLIDRATVIEARQAIVKYLANSGCIKAGTDPMDAILAAEPGHPRLMGNKEITHAPPVRAVLEARALFDFHSRYFGKDVLTFNYKWLRAVRPGENTGAHYDVIYMGRGLRENLRTNWIPFGDISMDMGPLAVCVGSHRLPGFARMRETYGKSDVTRLPDLGHFSNDPVEIIDKFGGKWQTSDFRMGDVLIFGMWTMHSSINNTSERYRISADVRFQPADEAVDERWGGDNSGAEYNRNQASKEKLDMAGLRKQWGVE